jgi:hypothetical protein
MKMRKKVGRCFSHRASFIAARPVYIVIVAVVVVVVAVVGLANAMFVCVCFLQYILLAVCYCILQLNSDQV